MTAPLIAPVIPPRAPWRAAGASFAVVFAAEWGDITQITTANLAARYGAPIPAGIGAVLALWLLAALAVTIGAKSLDVIPMTWVRRVTAVIMLGLAAWPPGRLAAWSAWSALS